MSGDGLSRAIWGVSVDDDATLGRMRRSDEDDGYLPCPHTAVGLEAVEIHRRETGEARPVMVLATAHPAKFPDAVERATGRGGPRSDALETLAHAPRDVTELDADPEALREALVALRD